MKNAMILGLASGWVYAACSTSNGARVSFSVTSRVVAAGAPATPGVTASGDSTVITLGSDSVIIRSAQFVLRKVELKSSNVATCDAITNAGCSEFESGATLVTLPLGSTVIATQVTITVPAGIYNAVEFEIHKPNSSDDPAFIAANPAFANISIRVMGTYSQAGTRSAFTFTSTVDQKQEASLVPALTFRDGQVANLTLRANLAGWFLNSSGTALVDPASANAGGANESVVANNLQNSFKVFEDDSRSGLGG